MTGTFADRLFRIAFALAGCYNLAFGIWASVWPLAFFELFELAPPRYPGIWACLGMVVGVYGLLYLHAAWKLETAWPIVVIGLLGKVLGPIGMLMSFGDDWPRRVGMLCVYNDLIWWLPFGLFLVRCTFAGRWLERLAPWLSIAFHATSAIFAAVFLRRGMPIESNATLRAAFIAESSTVWSIGWFLWMLSAMSFVGFCAWWGSRLIAVPDRQAARPSLARHEMFATIAVVVAALGTIFDFTGEGSLILMLVDHATAFLPVAGRPLQAWDAAAFVAAERNFTLYSAGIANLLYSIAGAALTLLTSDLPRWVRSLMWATWAAGALMTVSAVFDHAGGLVASSILLFPLLIIWTAWMGAWWRSS